MKHEDRFMKHVCVDLSGCWLWTARRQPKGYGTFKFAGKTVLAHRWYFERLHGPVPTGLELDHKCRVRRCVNPAHLEPVTHAENVRRSEPATKTHCVHGHEFTAENTFRRRRGGRMCRICMRVRNLVACAKYRAKRNSAA